MDAYNAYIESCKVPKNQDKIRNIAQAILDGLRKGYSTSELAEKLNATGVLTIQNKKWTYYALQMQLLKMSRMDSDSSLAWALATLIDSKWATERDIRLLKERTRVTH